MNGPSGVRRVGEATGRHGSRARRRGCAPGLPRACGVRPRLPAEWLEQRLLLSTWTVNSTADVLSTDSGYVGTLRWAVAQANAADAPTSSPSVIAFDPAIFASPRTITLTQGQLELTQGATTISGPGAGQFAVSGIGTARVMLVDARATAVVSGATIDNGGAAATGGGVSNAGMLTLTGCTLAADSATYGGGVSNSGTLAIAGSTLVGDSATYGGGVYNSGTLTITGSTLSDDSAPYGGGVSNGGTLAITGSTLSGDSATYGGGVDNSGTLTINGCTLFNDSAKHGGAIDGDRLTVTDSTLSGNSATVSGGAVSAFEPVTFNNDIVAADTAPAGPDLYSVLGNGDNGTYSGSNNLIGDGSGESGLGSSGTGNVFGSASAPLNPLVGPLRNNGGPTQTLALLPGSPAIDAGSNAFIPSGTATDQRGFIRVANVKVDIGAYEFGAASPGTATVVNSAADGTDYAPGTLTLRQAVSLADAADAPAPAPTVITFSPTVFGSSPLTIALSQGQLELTTGATTIAGPGADLLTISGNHESRVLAADAAVTQGTVSGLTIGGGISGDGGGIFNAGTLTLTGSALSGDIALLSGGGAYNAVGGTFTIASSTLSGDSAEESGGGVDNLGTLNVTASTLSGDSAASDGGGILNSGTLHVTGSTLSGDSATYDGGAVYNTLSGTVAITGSTLSADSGNLGGGVFSLGTIAITSSTLSGDSAKYGGAIDGDRLTVTDSTLSGNSATVSGGAVSAFEPVTFNNDIVAADTAPAGPDLYTVVGNGERGTYAGSNNLIGNGSGESGLTNGGTGNLVGTASAPINPMLGALRNYGGPTQTLALLPGSPAIDAGNNGLIPSGTTTDQRGSGYARIVDTFVDIGAYEVQPASAPTVVGVFVRSTQWSAAFPYAGGYPIPAGSAQLAALPWTNLNQVSITFDEAVNVTQAALTVAGVNKAAYATTGFSYNAATFTATWTFASPLAADKLRFDVAAAGANAVTAAAGGIALDGTFANGSSSFPSGGNAPGTDFNYDLNVLPGDVQQKGGPVNILEVIQTRNDQLKKPGDAGYSPFYDVDGSGGITILDVINVRNRQLGKLPAGSP